MVPRIAAAALAVAVAWAMILLVAQVNQGEAELAALVFFSLPCGLWGYFVPADLESAFLSGALTLSGIILLVVAISGEVSWRGMRLAGQMFMVGGISVGLACITKHRLLRAQQLWRESKTR